MQHISTTVIEKSLTEVWNERDADKRLQLIKKYYLPDFSFFEEGKELKGHTVLNDFIGNLLSSFPDDFIFRILEEPEVNYNLEKLKWQLGPTDIPPIATGMDIAVTEDTMIKALYVFLDKEPTGK